jgi:hypothetical protein
MLHQSHYVVATDFIVDGVAAALASVVTRKKLMNLDIPEMLMHVNFSDVSIA